MEQFSSQIMVVCNFFLPYVAHKPVFLRLMTTLCDRLLLFNLFFSSVEITQRPMTTSLKLPCGETKNHSQGFVGLWARKTRRAERKKGGERELADWAALPSPQRDFSFGAETVVSFVSISPSEPLWKMKLVDVRKAPVSCHTHAAGVTASDCLV